MLYQRIPKLFADLALARGDGRYARIQRALGGVQLLILDDWGLEPLDATARHDLLEILEERYGRRSTIITSQIPVDKWHELIGDPTYADAILDRIVHNAHRINLIGHSLRRSRATKPSKEWSLAGRSLATALPGGRARSRPALRPRRPIDRPTTECHKLSASEGAGPGRHHVGTPGDIISERPGDIISERPGDIISERPGDIISERPGDFVGIRNLMDRGLPHISSALRSRWCGRTFVSDHDRSPSVRPGC